MQEELGVLTRFDAEKAKGGSDHEEGLDGKRSLMTRIRDQQFSSSTPTQETGLKRFKAFQDLDKHHSEAIIILVVVHNDVLVKESWHLWRTDRTTTLVTCNPTNRQHLFSSVR